MCITGLTWAENRSDMDCEYTRRELQIENLPETNQT